MTLLSKLITEIEFVVQDPSTKYVGDNLIPYLNRAVNAIAGGIKKPRGGVSIPLPLLFVTTGTVDTSIVNTYVSMPDNYMRDLMSAIDYTGRLLNIEDTFTRFTEQYRLNDDSGSLSSVVVKGRKLHYAYAPTTSQEIVIHYFRKPTDMVAADPDGIAQAQAPVAAGNLTLNGAHVSGGVGTMPAVCVASLLFATDESARTLTITGTDTDGVAATEEITGGSGETIYGDQVFATVTQVEIDAASAGNISVGSMSIPDGLPSHMHYDLLVPWVAWKLFSQIEDGIEGRKVNSEFQLQEFFRALETLEQFYPREYGEIQMTTRRN